MKRIKKCLALVLTLAMVMAMGITAFAAEGSGYTVTINSNADDKGTHTYGAYQIFKGNLDAESGTLGNIEWGSGISENAPKELGDAATYAKGITEANAATKAVELAKYLTTAEKTGSTKIEGLAGGYYLIQDESTSPTGDNPKAKTKFILKVLKNETVNVKSSVPSVEKKVQDINDSDDSPTLSEAQDSADYDIGDSIPYTITATIGDGIDNYDSYSLQFVDTMSKGLTLNNDWTIKVGETDVTSNFTFSSNAADEEGNITHTWSITDLKKAATLEKGSQVVLTYSATLNEKAVVSSEGNPNTVVLKYDNNPNESGKGNPGGETPKDTNIVFTYKTVFNKVDEENQSLTGADFKLEKKVNGNWVDVTTLHNGEDAINPTKTGDTNRSTFTFSGLDDGDYRLTETTTPAGYNTIAPVEFKITATHDIESDNPKLTALAGTGEKEFTLTTVKSSDQKNPTPTGELDADILNQKGFTLPSTGGIGTTIFYVLGSILVVGAGVLLITRKRMGAQK